MADFVVKQRLYSSDLRILACRRDASVACDRVSVRFGRNEYLLCRKRVAAFFIAVDGVSLSGLICDEVKD